MEEQQLQNSELSYEEFVASIRENQRPRIYKIRNAIYGRLAQKYYTEHRPKYDRFILSRSEFSNIIRKIHENIILEVLAGNEVTFPYKMGSLSICQFTKEPKLDENGQLIFKAPVNWSETFKLWYESEEAHQNKILVLYDERVIYKIVYNTSKAVYKNKNYMKFRPHRQFKQKLSIAAKSGKLEAFKDIKNLKWQTIT